MLHDAPWLSIANLPAEVKTHIALHLEHQDFPWEYRHEIKKIVEFMHMGVGKNKDELIKNIQMLDYRRNESLKSVAPELADILKYE
jgi:hypothetical protein